MSSQGMVNYRRRLLQLAAKREAADLVFAPASAASGGMGLPAAVRPLYYHVAAGIELAFACRGEARVVTPAGIHVLSRGKLLVLERGVYHAELPGSPDRQYGVFWCHFIENRAELTETAYRGSRYLGHPELQLPGRSNVEAIAGAIASELSSASWGYARAVSGIINYVVCILMRRLERVQHRSYKVRESPVIATDARKWHVIHAVLDFCVANFRRGISREEVARAVGYSPGHLSHLFSTHMGQTLADHIRNLRITESKRLLAQPDSTIHAIARAVGYSDPAHFTRAFNRAVGMSPRDYRQRLEVA